MPRVAALRREVGESHFDLMPTGIYAGNGARPITSQLRDQARTTDQRIEAMTGQPFTETYFEQVLSDAAGTFDSGPASLILALADLLQPGCGFNFLAALQHARFVEGRDLNDRAVLIEVASEIGLSKVQIKSALQDTDRMTEAVDRITTGRRQLARYGIEGVPTLIEIHDDTGHVVPNALLVGAVTELTAHSPNPWRT